MRDYAVIIVGGGMVGVTLACALAQQLPPAQAIALIEERPLPAFDLHSPVRRVSAITMASQRILMQAGIWQRLLRVSPFARIRVWDATGTGEIGFDSRATGYTQLGFIVENAAIQVAGWQQLAQLAAQSAKIDTYCPVQVQQLSFADAAYVTLATGEVLRAALVIGADGADSRVRQWAGMVCYGWSYGQQAIVATVKTEYPHQATAWQRFAETGPLAFLPLADGDCSIVWSLPSAQAPTLMALAEADFAEALAQAFEQRLGRILAVQARAVFPLRLQQAYSYVQERLALVGDACHIVHPLAGQGVNLGLLDAATLAQIIVQTAQEGRDIGRFAYLKRYERWRRGENTKMLGLMEGFHRLFGSQQSLIRLARNWGLSQTNAQPFLKQWLMMQAMGLSGDLPDLAQYKPAEGLDFNQA